MNGGGRGGADGRAGTCSQQQARSRKMSGDQSFVNTRLFPGKGKKKAKIFLSLTVLIHDEKGSQSIQCEWSGRVEGGSQVEGL